MTKTSKVLFSNWKATNDFPSLLTIANNSVSTKDTWSFNFTFPSAQTGPSNSVSMMSPAIKKESTLPPLLENRNLSIFLSGILWTLLPFKKESGCS
jgi:hypothetical protein